MSQAASPESRPSAPIVWSQAQREGNFNEWLDAVATQHQLTIASLRVASADASFRRYFRIDSAQSTRIIMDAPPDQEDSRQFVKVAQLMHEAGLRVPQVLAWDQANGFMLLGDLGPQTMMQAMDQHHPQANQGWYLQAVDALIAWQLASRPGVLPAYDETLLRRELELFPEWYLIRHRSVNIDADTRRTLDEAFARIIDNNLAWPSVYVHRDFMPRNLIVGIVAPTLATSCATLPPEGAVPCLGRPGAAAAPTSATRLGVLDFQDAVYGPITYDIASLMRDAFLSWEEDFCLDITIRYWEKARKAGLPVGADFGEFYRGVEWMGLQRHLKVAGIFARLTLRDGKPQYLADTPRFVNYIRATCSRYRELKPLLRLIERVEGLPTVETYSFGRI